MTEGCQAREGLAPLFWTCATSSSERHPSQNHIPKLSSSTKTAWHFLPANRNPWNPRCLAALGRWHTQSEQAMFSTALCLLPSALTRKDSAERGAETQQVSHGQSLCEGLLWPFKGLHVFAKSLAKLRSSWCGFISCCHELYKGTEKRLWSPCAMPSPQEGCRWAELAGPAAIHWHLQQEHGVL